MNKNLLLWLILAVALPCARLPDSLNMTQWRPHNLTCHPALLDSYDLEPLALPTSQKNFICSGITNNCCSLPSQFKILKRWTSSKGGKKLARFYRDFLGVLEEIFDLLAKVEEFAKSVADGIPSGVTTNCGQLANAVLSLKASSAKKQVLADFQRAFRFLYDSRRGFYCALCDSDALAHILPLQGVIRVSRGFCGSLVTETMNAMSFKYEYFQKVARLYGQMLVSCNGAGEYDSRAKLKRAHLFFSRKRIMRDIRACKANIKSQNAITMCAPYCERFNPARLSTMFEGQIRQTSRFLRWFKRRLAGVSARAASPNNKDDLNFKGRILQDQPASTPATPAATPSTPAAADSALKSNDTKTTDGNTTISAVPVQKPVHLPAIARGINKFNKNYETKLLVPISFSARDIPQTSRRTLNQNESLFRLHSPPLFNLADFKLVVSKVGLNWVKYGYNALINDQGFKAVQAELTIQSASGTTDSKTETKTEAKTDLPTGSTPAAVPKVVRKRK
jgi:hypothetical protein